MFTTDMCHASQTLWTPTFSTSASNPPLPEQQLGTDINFVSRFDRWFLRQADRNFFFMALDFFKSTYAATGRVLGYHIISILHTNVIVIKSPISTKALFSRVFRGLNMRACYICTDSTVHDLAFVVFEDSCMAAAALFRFDSLYGMARFANVWCHASLNDDSSFRYEHYRLAVISFDNWQRRMHERYPKCRYLDTVCDRSRIQLSARQLFDSRDGHFHGRELYSGSRDGHIGFGSIHHLRCDAREHWPAHNLPLLNKEDYAAGSIQYCRAEMAELYYDGVTDPGSTTPTLSDFEMEADSDSECDSQSMQQQLPAAAAAIPLVPPPAVAAHAAAHAILVAGAIAPVAMVVPPAPRLVDIEPNPGPNHADRRAAARKLIYGLFIKSPPELPPNPDPEWPLPDPEHHPFPMPLPDVAPAPSPGFNSVSTAYFTALWAESLQFADNLLSGRRPSSPSHATVELLNVQLSHLWCFYDRPEMPTPLPTAATPPLMWDSPQLLQRLHTLDASIPKFPSGEASDVHPRFTVRWKEGDLDYSIDPFRALENWKERYGGWNGLSGNCRHWSPTIFNGLLHIERQVAAFPVGGPTLGLSKGSNFRLLYKHWPKPVKTVCDNYMRFSAYKHKFLINMVHDIPYASIRPSAAWTDLHESWFLIAISACVFPSVFPQPSVFPRFFPPAKPLVGVEKNPGPQCARCGRSTHSTNSCSEQTTSAGNPLLSTSTHRPPPVQRQSTLGDFFNHRPRRDHNSASQPTTQRQSTLIDFFPNHRPACTHTPTSQPATPRHSTMINSSSQHRPQRDQHSKNQPKITGFFSKGQDSRRNCLTPDGEPIFESWRQHKKRLAAMAPQNRTAPTASPRPNFPPGPPVAPTYNTRSSAQRNAATPVPHTSESASSSSSDPEHIRLAREECSRLRRLRFADSLEQLRREQSLAVQRARVAVTTTPPSATSKAPHRQPDAQSATLSSAFSTRPILRSTGTNPVDNGDRRIIFNQCDTTRADITRHFTSARPSRIIFNQCRFQEMPQCLMITRGKPGNKAAGGAKSTSLRSSPLVFDSDAECDSVVAPIAHLDPQLQAPFFMALASPSSIENFDLNILNNCELLVAIDTMCTVENCMDRATAIRLGLELLPASFTAIVADGKTVNIDTCVEFHLSVYLNRTWRSFHLRALIWDKLVHPFLLCNKDAIATGLIGLCQPDRHLSYGEVPFTRLWRQSFIAENAAVMAIWDAEMLDNDAEDIDLSACTWKNLPIAELPPDAQRWARRYPVLLQPFPKSADPRLPKWKAHVDEALLLTYSSAKKARDELKPRRSSQKVSLQMQEEVQKLRDAHFVYPAEHNPFGICSVALLVPKPDGKLRFTVNMKPVNALLRCQLYPLRSVEECLQWCAQWTLFAKRP
jgi:hypothetical protein